jgi:hypothetical protein
MERGMTYLLTWIGITCVIASLAHGSRVQSHLVATTEFRGRQAKNMTVMLLQYSTFTWILIGLFIAASPWLLDRSTRSWAVPLACLPILYGVIGNAIVSRGRHFGWILFAAIIGSASAAANL